MEISQKDIDKIHDLTTRISFRSMRQENDIRDLNNLVHVVMGTGIRIKEFENRDTPASMVEVERC
jgi:hypothetical protein